MQCPNSHEHEAHLVLRLEKSYGLGTSLVLYPRSRTMLLIRVNQPVRVHKGVSASEYAP